VLPDDIAVHEIFKAPHNANTRFDALSRTYEYFIHFHKNAFIDKFSLFQGFYPIDWEKIEAATNTLLQIKDFSSLCLPSEDFKTNICHLSHARWDVVDSPEKVLKPFSEDVCYDSIDQLNKQHFGVRFTITSNRFLRGMVRTVVGTLLMVGKNKISVQEFNETVFRRAKFRMQLSAPPRGLYLSQVKYPKGYPAD
jgi:tRNA pseudouridine38-40 synthase